MFDDKPLTLESAISLLRPAENTPPEDNQQGAAPENNDQPNSAAPEGDNNPPAEGDTPPANEAAAETDAPENDQGKANEGDVDPGDALPPIEPPSSLSAEEKAEWNSLPRKAQEIIQRREQDNVRALRNAQNSAAESNKKVEAEVARLKGVTDQLDTYLNEKVNDLAREFPEIKSEADLVALAASDPAKAQLFQAKLQALASATQARARAQQELTQKAAQQQQEQLVKAKDALIEAFPAWKDPEVARREVTELQDYAIKNYSVPEAAARSTVDPVIYKLAQKAMLWDKAQAAKEAALKRQPPRTLKPGAGAANPGKEQRETTRRSQLDKLTQSGDIDDARGLLRA